MTYNTKNAECGKIMETVPNFLFLTTFLNVTYGSKLPEIGNVDVLHVTSVLQISRNIFEIYILAKICQTNIWTFSPEIW